LIHQEKQIVNHEPVSVWREEEGSVDRGRCRECTRGAGVSAAQMDWKGVKSSGETALTVSDCQAYSLEHLDICGSLLCCHGDKEGKHKYNSHILLATGITKPFVAA